VRGKEALQGVGDERLGIRRTRIQEMCHEIEAAQSRPCEVWARQRFEPRDVANRRRTTGCRIGQGVIIREVRTAEDGRATGVLPA
jgi:hypothetical protein